MAKAKAPEAESALQEVSLIAIDPVRHDGAEIAPGEPFTASPAAAEALIAAGSAQAAAE